MAPNAVETLRYIGPEHAERDDMDALLEKTFLSTVQLEGEGMENIPPMDQFVLGFLPHSGWIEPSAIDYYLRAVRQPAVWISKIENESALPPWIVGNRRILFVNRGVPNQNFYQAVEEILFHPEGIIASAFEGTRKGNPANPSDLRSLAQAKAGLVRFAMNSGVPVLPVLVHGADQMIPEPEKAKLGKAGVVLELGRAILTKKKPVVKVVFSPPYSRHIKEGATSTGETSVKARASYHTDQIVRKILIPQLLTIDPSYPLGYYSSQK